MNEPKSANPHCPDHGDLALDLLLGDLDHDTTRRAERAMRECEACESWWRSIEGSESFQEVEQGVLNGLAGFSPTPGQSKPWLSELVIAASIVALAIGIPLIALQDRSPVEPIALELTPTTRPEPDDTARIVASDEKISSNGFEDDSATSWGLGPN